MQLHFIGREVQFSSNCTTAFDQWWPHATSVYKPYPYLKPVPYRPMYTHSSIWYGLLKTEGAYGPHTAVPVIGTVRSLNRDGRDRDRQ